MAASVSPNYDKFIIWHGLLLASTGQFEAAKRVMELAPHFKVEDFITAQAKLMRAPINPKIFSEELVNTPSTAIEICKDVVHEKTGTPKENIWVHSTHAITTPHAPGDPTHSPGEWPEQLTLFMDAVTSAITEAAEQAADSFQNAFAGFGTGTCDVNMNRDVQFPDGNWYIGLGGTMPSNKTMTVLRVNSLYGDPIGFFISYGIKPPASTTRRWWPAPGKSRPMCRAWPPRRSGLKFDILHSGWLIIILNIALVDINPARLSF